MLHAATRKLTLLALVAYLTVFASPFLASASETLYKCGFGHAPYQDYSGLSEEERKAAEETFATTVQTYNEALSGELSSDTCGEKNAYSQLLEKGDCTAGGSIVTEITEVIAPSIPEEDGALKDSQIITVYAGICCISSETITTTTEEGSSSEVSCPDVVTVYAQTYDECKSAVGDAISGSGSDEPSCSRRQWVISDSGLGIVKVVVKQIYTWGAFTVGSIAVMTIILNGVRIQMSGVSGDITEAKNKILQAVAGIVLLFLSGVILYTINPEFFS